MANIFNMASHVQAVSDNAVSQPPTAAEITGAFGAPAGKPTGWMGVIDDAGLGLTNRVWICVQKDGSWFYEALTKLA